MSDAIDRWTVGSVTITRVVEFEIGGFPPGFMFAGLTEERVKSVAWLHPYYADPGGTIRYAVQAYIIESQGRRIIVDTCVGNDKDRNNESWNHLKLPFLERLTAAGYPPELIDVVLCTHLPQVGGRESNLRYRRNFGFTARPPRQGRIHSYLSRTGCRPVLKAKRAHSPRSRGRVERPRQAADNKRPRLARRGLKVGNEEHSSESLARRDFASPVWLRPGGAFYSNVD